VSFFYGRGDKPPLAALLDTGLLPSPFGSAQAGVGGKEPSKKTPVSFSRLVHPERGASIRAA